MTAKIISGKEISKKIISNITTEVNLIKTEKGIRPGLVTILVGDHPSSISYVTLKIKTAKKIGFYEIQRNLSIKVKEKELIAIIKEYNNDPLIHGILVQLPLPQHINQRNILLAIAPEKDVDGFHPISLGNLFIEYREDQLVPCTPAGIMDILRQTNIKTEGSTVVVVGRSNLVGKPLSIMLMQSGFGGNATVTIVHSKTKDIKSITKTADILIVAIGKPEFIRGEDIKKGAVVIDVGVNRIGFKKTLDGRKIPILKGDVNFEQALQVASAITPVPGGVGPMTIALLMRNTLMAFKNSKKKSK